jgi:uncharacterized protein (DUF305 family)
MRHISFFSIVVALAALVLATLPAAPTTAQTPAADHQQHHPGTPEAVPAAIDACAGGLGSPPAGMAQNGMMAGTPAMGGGDMADMMGQFDLMFIDMMTPHHASAVAMAQVAASRAEHPEMRALAEDVINTQSAEIEQMRSWRSAWYPDAPTMPMMSPEQMMGMMQQMMDAMPNGMMGTPAAMPDMAAMGMMDMEQELAQLCATTENFDLAFIDAMIPHHQRAIMMAQIAVEQAQHPELKALAQEIIDAQQQEIADMQAWRAAWSGAATPAS